MVGRDDRFVQCTLCNQLVRIWAENIYYKRWTISSIIPQRCVEGTKTPLFNGYRSASEFQNVIFLLTSASCVSYFACAPHFMGVILSNFAFPLITLLKIFITNGPISSITYKALLGQAQSSPPFQRIQVTANMNGSAKLKFAHSEN